MAEGPLLQQPRENWGSRAGFVLAAIGSAVGLGNLWGFPYKVYANGGGAFLIPYIFAMVAIGIPLLILELSLGHMTQRAAPNAYRAINRRTEPVGWWGILLGFVIITYYPVILAWCGNFLVFCIQGIFNDGKLPWAAEGAEGVEKAKEFFNHTFLNEWTDAEIAAGAKPYALGGVAWPIVASLAAVWLAMYLCIFRGVRLVSKVVLWTVPLPWIMLLILTVRGLTLPGAPQGLNFFLHPKWELLAQPSTWRWAFGQMFFSMSLAFGVMITYASFLHRKSDINNNAAIIGLADVSTSFVAGIAVFATLGAMAFATQQGGHAAAVTDVVKKDAGLAFIAFPYALAQLPYAPWFGAVFFIALLTLGIDSAFSITESILASLVDKTGWSRGRTLIGMTLVGFGLGLFYCARGGLAWLGTIDAFINDPWGGIALLGLLEAVVIGWAYRIGRLREHANERSDWRLGVWWDWIIRYLAPIVLSALFAWSVLDKFASEGGLIYDAAGKVNPPKLIGLLIALAVPILAVILSVIRSPGADTHAEHVGQPSQGREAGVLATVLALQAITIMVVTVSLLLAGVGDDHVRVHFALKVPGIWHLPLAAAAFALAAIVAGGVAVSRAEKDGRRASGFSRLAAGTGTLTLGSAVGVALYCIVTLNPTAEAAEVATDAAAATEKPAEVLSLPSWIMLAAMIVMLVVGLGWCFYRAIRASAAAGAPEPQRAEL